MTGITLNGNPKVAHINSRNQQLGTDDDPEIVPADDIKLQYSNVPIWTVAPFLGTADEASIKALIAALYHDTGEPRFPYLGTDLPIGGTEIQGHRMVVGVGDGRKTDLTRVRLLKMTLRPGHTVDLDCSVTVVDPPAALRRAVQKAWHNELPVRIEPTDQFDMDAWLTQARSKARGDAEGQGDMFDASAPQAAQEAPQDADPGKPTEAEQGVFAQKLAEAQAAKDGEVEKGDRDPLFAQACELVTSGQVECETKAITARFQVGAERGAALVRALVKAGVDKAAVATPISAGKKKAAAKKKAADGDGDLSPNLH